MEVQAELPFPLDPQNSLSTSIMVLKGKKIAVHWDLRVFHYRRQQTASPSLFIQVPHAW